MNQQDELTELLSQLAGSLRDEDLEDPELTVLLSQLVTIFEGKPEDLPPDLVEQLLQVVDKKERFIQAAMALGAGDPNSLKALSDSMNQAGLFKTEKKIQKIEAGKTPQASLLGYTRSGKSVHGMKPAGAYPKSVFTSEDHKDAAALHYAHSKEHKSKGKPTKAILHHATKHIEASGSMGFNPKEHWDKHKEALTRIRKSDPLKKAEKPKKKILIIQGGSRNRNSCPGKDTKTLYIAKAIKELVPEVEIDLLDLSIKGEKKQERVIRPCKGCIGTAGGFHCHWKCSCWGPKSAAAGIPDVMHDEKVYDRLQKADGYFFMTPIQWYMPTGQLVTMIQRMVCANGTITREDAVNLTENDIKNPAKTIALEKSEKYDHLKKNHLQGKIAAVFAHGDDGADDYMEKDGQTEPETGAQYSNPRQAIDGIVGMLRYSGIDTPEELIFTINRNKGNDYYKNDETFASDERFVKGAVGVFRKLIQIIEEKEA